MGIHGYMYTNIYTCGVVNKYVFGSHLKTSQAVIFNLTWSMHTHVCLRDVWFTSMTRLVEKPSRTMIFNLTNARPIGCRLLPFCMAYTLGFCTNWDYTHSCTYTCMHTCMHTPGYIHIEIAHSVNICSVMACRALGKPLQGSVAVSGCLKEPPMPLSWKKDGYSFWVVSSKLKFDHHLQFGTLH